MASMVGPGRGPEKVVRALSVPERSPSGLGRVSPDAAAPGRPPPSPPPAPLPAPGRGPTIATAGPPAGRSEAVARGARRAAAAAPDSGDGRADPPFAGLVRDALAHLYDPVALRRHPLAGGGAAAPGRPRRGRPVSAPGARSSASCWRPSRRCAPPTPPAPGPPRPPAAPGGATGCSRCATSRPCPWRRCRRGWRSAGRSTSGRTSAPWPRWPRCSESGGGRRTATAAAPPAGPPPRAAAPTPPHNLPLQLTSFVGRERELAVVRRLLERGPAADPDRPRRRGQDAPGAAGRAADLLDAVPGRRLARRAGAAGRPGARAAGRRRGPGRARGAGPAAAGDAAGRARAPRRLLLVLDNCEHLVDGRRPAGRGPAGGRARACTVLATSREPLRRRRGGTSPASRPSPCPTRGRRPPGAALAAYEAVRAVRRAGARRAAGLRPDRARTPPPWPRSARAGRPPAGPRAGRRARAGARRRGSSPARLGRPLPAADRRAAGRRSPRQQTLRAAVDWSHDLLAEPERVLFGRLAVFAGGFTLEAAEAVCGEVGLAGRGGRLGGEPSLAPAASPRRPPRRARPAGGSVTSWWRRSAGGGLRYRLLDTLREYAQERLGVGGEAPAARGPAPGLVRRPGGAGRDGLHGPQQAGVARPAGDGAATTSRRRWPGVWRAAAGGRAAPRRGAGAPSGACAGRGAKARRWLEALLAAGPDRRAGAGPGPPRRRHDEPVPGRRRPRPRPTAAERGAVPRPGRPGGVADLCAHGTGVLGTGRDRRAPAGLGPRGLAAGPAAGEPASSRGRSSARGRAALDAGELRPAAAYLEESLALYRSVDNPGAPPGRRGAWPTSRSQRGDLPAPRRCTRGGWRSAGASATRGPPAARCSAWRRWPAAGATWRGPGRCTRRAWP